MATFHFLTPIFDDYFFNGVNFLNFNFLKQNTDGQEQKVF